MSFFDPGENKIVEKIDLKQLKNFSYLFFIQKFLQVYDFSPFFGFSG